MKFNFVYKITNIVNNKIYIGKHSTDNIKDGYMGSGLCLGRAIKKYGIDKFKREILYEFDTKKEAYLMEAKIVNKEFIKRKDTYNIKLGGEGGWDHTRKMVTIKDSTGNCFNIPINDPRYLSGELIGVTKGFIPVKDENGNTSQVSVNDHRYLSGELVGIAKGLVMVKDENGNTSQVSVNDHRYLSGELVHIAKGLVMVKDENNNIYKVSKNDSRYLSGELVGIWKGRNHSEETKRKISKSNKNNHIGKLNSQYGTCWIMNEKLQKSKKIKKEDLQYWLNIGWSRGRKMSI